MLRRTSNATGAIGPADYRWLVSSAAAPWLELARESAQPLTALVAQLRRDLSAEQTHLVVEQVELRRRGRAKFAAAERMFFTARGLEQSTDEIVAAYKAARFPAGRRIFDLCTGVGGDLLALARRGAVTGFDLDPILAIVAQANVEQPDESHAPQAGGSRAEVHVRDVRELDLTECDAWHLDPDRRASGRRTTQIEHYEPDIEAIDQLLAQNSHAAIKLAPAATPPAAWLERAEWEWISRARECRQLVAWFGSLAYEAGKRRATILGSHGEPPHTVLGSPCQEPPAAQHVLRYLFEPDAAILAADLGGALAQRHQLQPLAAGLAYWTGDARVDDRALACFEVLEVLPFHLRTLKPLLRSRGIGELEIKKRGVPHDPAQVRKQLALSGEHSATLFLTRLGKQTVAIVARRAGEP